MSIDKFNWIASYVNVFQIVTSTDIWMYVQLNSWIQSDLTGFQLCVCECSSFFINKILIIKMTTKSRTYTNGIKCKWYLHVKQDDKRTNILFQFIQCPFVYRRTNDVIQMCVINNNDQMIKFKKTVFTLLLILCIWILDAKTW